MSTMRQRTPVVSAATQVLAHVPHLVRYGSKPSRELARNPGLAEDLAASLRNFEEAVGYPPHQAYLGRLHPRELPERPWVQGRLQDAGRFAPYGEIMPEEEYLGLLVAVDEFDLLTLAPDAAEKAESLLARHPLVGRLDLERLGDFESPEAEIEVEPKGGQSLPLYLDGGRLAGRIRADHEDDESLTASVLLENLTCKATATLALLHLLEDGGIDPTSIDYVISCSEEAVGDRYQRGGGNMGKAVAGMAGCTEASGADVKNFCAAPIPAMVMAGSLVASGVFERVAVVSGGSLAKLGMKFQGHLRHGLPVLEDVLGGSALLVEADNGRSPRLRLDAVGRHRVGAGASNPQIMEALAVEPLARLGLKMTDVDDFATELHNPEITEPQGSGDVPARNYKTIAALAAKRGEIGRSEIGDFVRQRGMPGFAPTQGHLASALCYLPHALRRLEEGQAKHVHLLAKGSLFLGRMCQHSDGMSVLLDRNEGSTGSREE
jgi:hypothetical protein